MPDEEKMTAEWLVEHPGQIKWADGPLGLLVPAGKHWGQVPGQDVWATVNFIADSAVPENEMWFVNTEKALLNYEKALGKAVDNAFQNEYMNLYAGIADLTNHVVEWKGKSNGFKLSALTLTQLYKGIAEQTENPHPAYARFAKGYGYTKGEVQAIVSANDAHCSFAEIAAVLQKHPVPHSSKMTAQRKKDEAALVADLRKLQESKIGSATKNYSDAFSLTTKEMKALTGGFDWKAAHDDPEIAKAIAKVVKNAPGAIVPVDAP